MNAGETHVASFVNEPLIEAAGLLRGASSWRLHVTLRFANDCLAKAGVQPEYLDLSVRESARDRNVRVVFIRQRPNPQGCPDIFMPVSRTVDINMDPLDDTATVAILNTTAAFSNAAGDLKIRLIEASTAMPSTKATTTGVRATDLSRRDYFPVLDRVSVTAAGVPGQGTLRYTVEFDALAPSACHLEPGLAIRHVSGPTAEPGPDNAVAGDFLFVYTAGTAECSTKTAGTVRRSHRVAVEVSASYRRRLVVVNRVRGGAESPSRPFTSFDIE